MNMWSYTDLWMKCPPPTDSDTSPFLHLVRWFVYRLPHWTHLLENLKNSFSKEFKFKTVAALVPNTLGITTKQKYSPGGSFSKLIVKKQVLRAYLIFQIFYFFSWFKNLENFLVYSVELKRHKYFVSAQFTYDKTKNVLTVKTEIFYNLKTIKT